MADIKCLDLLLKSDITKLYQWQYFINQPGTALPTMKVDEIAQVLNQYKVTSVIAKRQKILLVIFRILTPRIVLHRPSLKNASYPPLPFHKQKGAVLKAKNPPTLTCRPLLTSCSAVSWKLHHLFTRTYFHPWKNS